ncbi:MAG: mechanosensitive ion channel [Magnetococcales bacterium]|nr:mechanosensitive ion channel [Magnetococcales bacterium]
MIHPEIFEILLWFAVFVAASVLSSPLRLQSRLAAVQQESAKNRDQPPVIYTPWRLLLGPPSRPAIVLFLTFAASTLLFPLLPEALHPSGDHVRAWNLFWTAVLLFNATEGVSRLYYQSRSALYPIPDLLFSILRFFFVSGSALMVFSFVLQVNVSPILTSTAIFSAAVGLAVKELLVDLLDGLIMHLSRSVVPGDWIALEKLEGEVLATSWHETRIRTTDGFIYVVPNTQIARAVVHNMTWPDPVRRHSLFFNVAFGESPREVETALVEAALNHPEVRTSPAPDAYPFEYKESSVVYRLRFWSPTYFDRGKLQGIISRNVWYQFKRRRIEIPLPVSGHAVFSLLGRERRMEDRLPVVEQLSRSDFVNRLLTDGEGRPLITSEQLAEFTGQLRKRIFGPGEVIFRQGDVGEYGLIVLSGRLACEVRHEGGGQTVVHEEGPGGLVGEISLITGLHRTATISAVEETEALEVNRDSLALLFEYNPEIPGIISELASARAARSLGELEKMQAEKDAEAALSIRPENILKRLLKFSRWQRTPRGIGS